MPNLNGVFSPQPTAGSNGEQRPFSTAPDTASGFVLSSKGGRNREKIDYALQRMHTQTDPNKQKTSSIPTTDRELVIKQAKQQKIDQLKIELMAEQKQVWF
jgi:hypothetical protein